MLPKRERLSRDRFASVAKAGKRLHTAHFAFSLSGEAAGYAVVVAKQVARLSVTRHRLKRQVTAALRALGAGSPLPRALIIFARAGATSLSYQEIKAEIEAGLKRIA